MSSTLDGDVLTVLARADAEMTGRQIQRLAGHGSHQGIRNAADRLTKQGIVLRRGAGNANLYKLNRSHVAAPWVEGLAGLSEQVLERLRNTIGTWTPPPVLAVLFGSVATGHATPTSDLDRPPASHQRLTSRADMLARARDVPQRGEQSAAGS
jgi:Nucleotidyltransferase domain